MDEDPGGRAPLPSVGASLLGQCASVCEDMKPHPERLVFTCWRKQTLFFWSLLCTEVVGAFHQQPHTVDGDDPHNQQADGSHLQGGRGRINTPLNLRVQVRRGTLMLV